ncbi:MBL fold metallo-hydrolase [Natranaerobius thermophilus]|uniref:Beta-lactamase domain protein n=1 Tax=Natranaerobius thermophilus (strain ATCC BAA-1301 / DSM 18059 / JW/NM-WN-LF) TaxID=457570 RepID=B2A5U4_NATTJ|nr:MBL fold metallo-hydrolase [Natranaerobius thermophilus]ACB84037.1 beta-lactamase domain protein [Natranaerobius thermophilus JW/NM-WN-LF]
MKMTKAFMLRVLGRYAPFPAKNSNCSGYLLTAGEDNFLFDCGNGVLSNLQNYLDLSQLSALFITHHHSDHVADLIALRHAYEDLQSRGEVTSKLPVYTPPYPQDTVAELEEYPGFDIKFLAEGEDIIIEDKKISWSVTNHFLYCAAYRVEYKEKAFVYTGDNAYDNETIEDNSTADIINLSKGADLLLTEASLEEEWKKEPEKRHMSARDAASLAKEAQVKHMVISHFHPRADLRKLLRESKQIHPNTSLAVEGTSYLV